MVDLTELFLKTLANIISGATLVFIAWLLGKNSIDKYQKDKDIRQIKNGVIEQIDKLVQQNYEQLIQAEYAPHIVNKQLEIEIGAIHSIISLHFGPNKGKIALEECLKIKDDNKKLMKSIVDTLESKTQKERSTDPEQKLKAYEVDDQISDLSLIVLNGLISLKYTIINV